jgi:DNA-binding transcriptional LysR family regulator
VKNSSSTRTRSPRAGVGLTLADDRVRDEVARGDLVRVLDEFFTPFPGFYLYYPQRRHASAALRALIDHLRRARRASPDPKPPTGRRGAGKPR